MQHRFTAGAIALVLVLLLPGLFIGRHISKIYSFFLSFILSSESLIDWIFQGWPGVIAMQIFPNLMHGFVAGALAVGVSSLVLKKSNYDIVAYSIALLLIFLVLLIIGILYAREGFRPDFIDLTFLTAGVVAGLFLLAGNRGSTLFERP